MCGCEYVAPDAKKAINFQYVAWVEEGICIVD